jgi:hypothetical protein
MNVQAALTLSILATLACAAPLHAQGQAPSQATFVRPDCVPSETDPGAESRCIRAARNAVRDANFAALQKTGLMFRSMARPDLAQHPDAKAALEQKVEGSFLVRFSVAPDGTVYNVATSDVTEGVAPLAQMWAQTIAQWTFAKVERPVTDIEHRRIYLHPRQEEAEAKKKPQGAM